MAQFLDVRSFSRREFLKLSGAALLALLAFSRKPSLAFADDGSDLHSDGLLGRITKNGIKMYDQASESGNPVKTLDKDTLVAITNTTIGEGSESMNSTWYELDGEGFVHSGWVQPVENLINSRATRIPDSGLLAEVSVPFTDAVWDLENPEKTTTRLYYATTHWILGLAYDNFGNWWYEVLEDFYDKSYFINPKHLRIIAEEEITPLSSTVPANEKKLEVHLAEQLVIAYEADSQVQLFRCSAGITKNDEILTPTGDFRTDYKRPSRHMIDGNNHHMNTYNLPGVPWISYLDENGISFHGTYWHNNFGIPMSHGCINLPPAAAKWIYRWSMPTVAYSEQKGYKLNGGTPVTIL